LRPWATRLTTLASARRRRLLPAASAEPLSLGLPVPPEEASFYSTAELGETSRGWSISITSTGPPASA
jgi:NTE family protein